MKRASTPDGRRCGDARPAVGARPRAALRWLVLPGLIGFLAAAAPEPVVQTRAEPVLVESVAFDARGRLLVSAIHAAGIFRIAPDGRLMRWSRAGSAYDACAIFGIAADARRNILWAAASPDPHGGTLTVGPALLGFDLRTGRLRKFARAPDGAGHFGDIAIGPDGAVYISDSGAAIVFRLAPGTSALEPVIKLEGARNSPQGLAVSDDGRRLVFSNYGDGLHRIDLATGAHTRVLDADGRSPRGIDGVSRRGDDLILVYNATQPARVVRATLDPDWTRIVATETLAEGAPLEEPTGGVIRGDDFVFVSRSQWTDFDSGARAKPSLGSAIISRIALPTRSTGTRSGG